MGGNMERYKWNCATIITQVQLNEALKRLKASALANSCFSPGFSNMPSFLRERQ
jgi:hypothetical protein